jgi:hypothetical protein
MTSAGTGSNTWHQVGCLLLLLGALSLRPAASAAGEEVGLTFFGWSDQHVQVNGDGTHLHAAIDAMNALPGTPYPASIGGAVDAPAFVFGCGDITEWPTHAAKDTYARLTSQRLKFPTYDVAGNHDEGGKSPSETIKKWLIERHGALTYAFQSGGIRFVCLYSAYDETLNNPAQPLTRAALAELQALLAQAPADQPTIVATHLCYDAITNRQALLDVLRPYRVLAILGGHYHKAKIDREGGRLFLQLPSPAPGSLPEVMVVRISPERLVALPYDYAQRRWSTDPRKVVDMPLTPPPFP